MAQRRVLIAQSHYVERTILPHTALTEPANVGHRKINWPCRSEAGGTSATAEYRMLEQVGDFSSECGSPAGSALPDCDTEQYSTPMRALTFAGRDQLEWRDIADPVVTGSGEAVVRPLAVATCDLDIEIIRRRTPFEPPFVLGHETAHDYTKLVFTP
ncbi:hypothetical protein ACIRRA_44545 [Nocardia sp. NPDC101769]|uniref:hypothetical protein n=1 Tax=Nocardia sp. NPDC101769 TaxID=3364333 RepID=UPI0037FCDFFB